MAITVADTDLNVTYARPGDVIRWLGADALDEAEQARATCISNKARHQHFIAGRTLLRHSLSAAVRNAVEPAAWRFARSTYGKSSVTPGLPPIHFSISHAEGLVAVATSPTTQVGMDLELETGNGDTSLVLDHLTGREQAWLERQCDADRWQAFLRLWTAKEAMTKAVGIGCAVDFREIEIDVPTGCVRCPEGLIGTDDHLSIDMRTIDMQGFKYCFSVACLQTARRDLGPSIDLLCARLALQSLHA